MEAFIPPKYCPYRTSIGFLLIIPKSICKQT
jgi:hypothetical protein